MTNNCDLCKYNQNGRCQSPDGYRGTYITSISPSDKENCRGYRR